MEPAGNVRVLVGAADVAKAWVRRRPSEGRNRGFSKIVATRSGLDGTLGKGGHSWRLGARIATIQTGWTRGLPCAVAVHGFHRGRTRCCTR